MAENKNVTIKPAKGRPMLTWVGKRPLRHVTAFPAQQVEVFDAAQAEGPSGRTWEDWPDEYPQGGLLFHGDNKEVLAHLLANGFRGKVKLIYIDPPFDSGADYVRKVSLRGAAGTAKLDGEDYTLGEQVQYSDIWANDNYLQFMYERLLLLRELLAEDGGLWLHCDWHRVHLLRCLVEEIFAPENFRNEVVWAYPGREMHIENKFNAKHDDLLFVAKSDAARVRMSAVAIAYDRDTRLRGLRRKIHIDENGREWVWETRGQAAGQEPYKRYVDEIIAEGHALNDVWDDIQFLRGNDPERTGFPTQKSEALLERIVRACSDPGDLVLDCFIGSGTTPAVAQKLGRRWIACDINKGAIQTTTKRLMAVMREQAAQLAQAREKPPLPDMDSDEAGEPAPAQLSFTVYRVNDYDLQIQHNEAVELACQHIGVTRSRSDAFFDGTLGKRLVRIVPFGHPITLLDLEEVKRELDARPDEDRDVVVVGLGKELAVDGWTEEWNRMRRSGNAPNRIDVIELRTDPKYGGFISHQPADARVKVERADGKLRVTVEDFISPSIIARLKQQAGVLQPQVDDWRAMVDSVMIDPVYDGQVFNVALADVPARKSDLVAGVYEFDAPEGETTVAVKVTDMLGEEVLKVAVA